MKHMSRTGEDWAELKGLHKKHSPTYGGKIEDYFPLSYLVRKHKLSEEDALEHVAFGNKDLGIDAYYIDREAKNLYLYQFKWTGDHFQFKPSIELLIKVGMATIFGSERPATEVNRLVYRLKGDLSEHKALIERVYIRFVFKGNVDDAEKSAGLMGRKEELEGKRFLLENFFSPRNVDLAVDFVSDTSPPPPPPPPPTFEVRFSEKVSAEVLPDGKKLYIGFAPIMDFYAIYKSLGQKFLSRNIRSGLSPDKPPNKKIREALKNIVIKKQELPETFVFHHNGVALASSSANFENSKVVLKSPYLLNGAQTLKSLEKFIEDGRNNPAFEQNKVLLDRIKVLVKLIEDNPHSEFITSVTISNNRQNPVEAWHLRANDRIQCDLEDMFKEVGIFYSRQENAFFNLSTPELESLGIIEKTRDIRIRPLAQTFLATQGEVDKISRLTEVFENQKLYEKTFRHEYLRADTRKIVLAYKVQYFVTGVVKFLEDSSSPAPSYLKNIVSKARNLVWALLIQGILNDSNLDGYVEAYGTGLTRETSFREILKQIARTRIVPIMREVLRVSSYQERIHKDKLEFLRTNDMYSRCMNVAAEKYGWKKKSF